MQTMIHTFDSKVELCNDVQNDIHKTEKEIPKNCCLLLKTSCIDSKISNSSSPSSNNNKSISGEPVIFHTDIAK